MQKSQSTKRHQRIGEKLVPRQSLTLKQGTRWGKDPESTLTYVFAVPEEQVSGSTNQNKPKPPSGDHVTFEASLTGKEP